MISQNLTDTKIRNQNKITNTQNIAMSKCHTNIDLLFTPWPREKKTNREMKNKLRQLATY